MAFYDWRPYVPVATRRQEAQRELNSLSKKGGQRAAPVVIAGRAIATTFWGKAWCENLERYSDFANRLPRGRTYVRNGSVVDLQMAPGVATALVSGSSLYTVTVTVGVVPRARWTAICNDCTGAIDSLVELLQGRLSSGVMARLCQPGTGLFPSPAEISFSCSCPDWAAMCKHVAAVLYGIGARLDEQPHLLFGLRQVDHEDLIARAGTSLPRSGKSPVAEKALESDDLSAIFGIEMAEPPGLERAEKVPKPLKARKALKVTKARKALNAGKALTARTVGRSAKKIAAKKSAGKKSAAKKSAAKKSTVKKSTATKSMAKKRAAKKVAKRATRRRG